MTKLTQEESKICEDLYRKLSSICKNMPNACTGIVISHYDCANHHDIGLTKEDYLQEKAHVWDEYIRVTDMLNKKEKK